jgi:cytochrome P450
MDPGLAHTPLFDVTCESLALSRSAYCPFSLGARQCIGKNLAYMELLISIARVVWLFEFRFAKLAETGGGSPLNAGGGRD